jgi:hypothetical protein
MPTITVQITEVKRVQNNIIFTARQGDNVITREVDVGEFDTWLKFAQWIVNQAPDFVLQPDKQKSVDITFHTVTNPETGLVTRVVDSVSAS